VAPLWVAVGLSCALQYLIPIFLSIYQEQRFILGRPRLRWENNIKMDLQEVWWGSTGWIALASGFVK